MREDVPLGPRMPAFDAEWDSVKWLTITWPPQPPPGFPPARLSTNSCQASFSQRCRCQGSAWLTDRLQQMVSEAPGSILKAGFGDLFHAGG